MHDDLTRASEDHHECIGRIDRLLFELVGRLRFALENGLKETTTLHLAEFNVLHFLAEQPEGGMRLGDLARRLSFSPSRLSYQVRTLEKRGLLTRHPSEEDGRGAYAVISEDGRVAYAKALNVYRNVVKRAVCDSLEEEEAKIFLHTLSRLNDSVSVSAINGALHF